MTCSSKGYGTCWSEMASNINRLGSSRACRHCQPYLLRRHHHVVTTTTTDATIIVTSRHLKTKHWRSLGTHRILLPWLRISTLVLYPTHLVGPSRRTILASKGLSGCASDSSNTPLCTHSAASELRFCQHRNAENTRACDQSLMESAIPPRSHSALSYA